MCVFRKDAAGCYIYANGRFCETVGKALEEVLGRTDFDIFTPELAEKYRQTDLRLLETGRGVEKIEEHRSSACGPHCRCGGRRSVGGPLDRHADTTYLQVLLTPLLDGEGQTFGIQGAFWDVTPRLAAEQPLRQLAANLERANREAGALQRRAGAVRLRRLARPAGAAAHGGQLRAAAGSAATKASSTPTPTNSSAIAVDGATRMQRLINDLLDLLAGRHAAGELAAGSISARSLERRARQPAGGHRRKRRRGSTHGLLPDGAGRCARSWCQLFQNLIGNALKFRRTAAPVIRVDGRARGRELAVSRSRTTASASSRSTPERIFVIFQRLHTPREYPGNGHRAGHLQADRRAPRRPDLGRVAARTRQSFFFTLPVVRNPVVQTASADASSPTELV